MPIRVRVSLLAILAAFWFVLAAARFAHGQPFVAFLYFACGAVLTVLARRTVQRGH